MAVFFKQTTEKEKCFYSVDKKRLSLLPKLLLWFCWQELLSINTSRFSYCQPIKPKKKLAFSGKVTYQPNKLLITNSVFFIKELNLKTHSDSMGFFSMNLSN